MIPEPLRGLLDTSVDRLQWVAATWDLLPFDGHAARGLEHVLAVVAV